MSIAITNDQNYSNIAAAIRAKLGVQTEYKPSEMAAAITSIPSGGGGSLTSTNFTSSEGSKTLDRTGSIGDMTFSFNSADSPTAQYYFATVECCGTGVGGLKVFYSAFVILNAQFQKVGEYAETTQGVTNGVAGISITNFLGNITLSTTQPFPAGDFTWRWIGCWLE